jgi:quinoprotein dehydrogenase-associated probable ABC transporter substrate-binding protein
MARGPDGEGSSYAPALSNSLKTMNYADFGNVVVNGRKNVNTAQEEPTPFRADDRKSMRTSPRAAAQAENSCLGTQELSAAGRQAGTRGVATHPRFDRKRSIMSSVNGEWLRLSLRVACTAVAAMFPSGKLLAQAAERPDLSLELVDPKVLRVCADPHNMPFSTERGEGFENKLAELLADKLGKGLSYSWYPQATGFVRNTLAAHKCDVIMGVPQGDDLVQVTNPYYRTAYALVFKQGHGLEGVDTLGDSRLKNKHIGIVAGTPPGNNMVANGLMANAKPYPLVIDTRVDSSAAAMMHDLATGEIDAGILWGPMAGYYARQATPAATVVPMVKETTGPRLTYRIAMGVRYTDQEWKRLLNRTIGENQPAINKLLLSFGVPLLDDDDRAITEDSIPR